ncbi:MAG: dihydroorotase [Rickettsiales bacterium]
MFDLIVKGGTCFTPSGRMRADVGIKNGAIAALGDLGKESAREILDAGGLCVLPGLIDTQVHFRDPGAPHKEDFPHGTAAAALGGVTGVFDMPNTHPSTTTKDAFANKMRNAEGRSFANYAFYVGATGDQTDLGELERLPGCCGVKIFMGSSTGSLLVEDDAALERVLRSITRRAAVHAEDEPRLKERKHLAVEAAHPSAHPIWRDEETAFKATRRIVSLAKKLGKRLHVLHVTTAEELQFLSEHKDFVTVECLPQHLVFTDADYETLGTRLQMNPPIRAARHQEALWKAMQEGVVDILGSDHAPHTLEEKAQKYPATPSGMPGVQTIVPVMLDCVNRGKTTLERVVDLMASSPQRIFGLVRKGRLTVGYDADLTLADMEASFTFKDENMRSKCGWTPFHGRACKGAPTHTIIGGTFAMREGRLQEIPLGKPFAFLETIRTA